jgi:hypothetical protein
VGGLFNPAAPSRTRAHPTFTYPLAKNGPQVPSSVNDAGTIISRMCAQVYPVDALFYAARSAGHSRGTNYPVAAAISARIGSLCSGEGKEAGSGAAVPVVVSDR